MITVVTGLPRSGTSLLMQLLEAGGIPAWSDGVRSADPDNPRGYLEHEAVKSLANSPQGLVEAEGRAVKVVVPLIPFLPPEFEYDVYYVRRPLEAVLASQERMLKRRGLAPAAADTLERAYTAQSRRAQSFLGQLSTVRMLYLDFDEVVSNPPEAARRIAAFSRTDLDAAAMAHVVDASLRHHPPTTVPGGGALS